MNAAENGFKIGYSAAAGVTDFRDHEKNDIYEKNCTLSFLKLIGPKTNPIKPETTKQHKDILG